MYTAYTVYWAETKGYCIVLLQPLTTGADEEDGNGRSIVLWYGIDGRRIHEVDKIHDEVDIIAAVELVFGMCDNVQHQVTTAVDR